MGKESFRELGGAGYPAAVVGLEALAGSMSGFGDFLPKRAPAILCTLEARRANMKILEIRLGGAFNKKNIISSLGRLPIARQLRSCVDPAIALSPNPAFEAPWNPIQTMDSNLRTLDAPLTGLLLRNLI